LQQISTKDYDIVEFAHDQCHFCINSTKDRIGPKLKSYLNTIENGPANLTDLDLWKSDGIQWIWNRILNPSHPYLAQVWNALLLDRRLSHYWHFHN